MTEAELVADGWHPRFFWAKVQGERRWTSRTRRLLVSALTCWQEARDEWLESNVIDARITAITEWAETGDAEQVGRVTGNAQFGLFAGDPDVVLSWALSIPETIYGEVHDDADRYWIEVIRDILGNPFRPVTLDPAWRTEAVVALAAGIYADRAFERLPVLADALDDAGCANPDVLGHCRSTGPHARGCWVVDLILGKA